MIHPTLSRGIGPHPFDLLLDTPDGSGELAQPRYFQAVSSSRMISEFDCAGTVGTAGTVGGTAGTFGTFGCCC